jgi:predicted PP-loop superfamily ATPase
MLVSFSLRTSSLFVMNKALLEPVIKQKDLLYRFSIPTLGRRIARDFVLRFSMVRMLLENRTSFAPCMYSR